MDDLHKVNQLLNNADISRISGYLQMFDRILLYRLAKGIMPKEDLSDAIGVWSLVAKKGIDLDAKERTEFLETTPAGRAAKLRKEADGETIRLHNTKQLDIAKQIINTNLHMDDDYEGGFGAGVND